MYLPSAQPMGDQSGGNEGYGAQSSPRPASGRGSPQRSEILDSHGSYIVAYHGILERKWLVGIDCDLAPPVFDGGLRVTFPLRLGCSLRPRHPSQESGKGMSLGRGSNETPSPRKNTHLSRDEQLDWLVLSSMLLLSYWSMASTRWYSANNPRPTASAIRDVLLLQVIPYRIYVSQQ
jgi:hypothetical protein